jgi:hypothetical protein
MARFNCLAEVSVANQRMGKYAKQNFSGETSTLYKHCGAGVAVLAGANYEHEEPRRSEVAMSAGTNRGTGQRRSVVAEGYEGDLEGSC